MEWKTKNKNMRIGRIIDRRSRVRWRSLNFESGEKDWIGTISWNTWVTQVVERVGNCFGVITKGRGYDLGYIAGSMLISENRTWKDVIGCQIICLIRFTRHRSMETQEKMRMGKSDVTNPKSCKVNLFMVGISVLGFFYASVIPRS